MMVLFFNFLIAAAVFLAAAGIVLMGVAFLVLIAA
jgi:hypothetical protein